MSDSEPFLKSDARYEFDAKQLEVLLTEMAGAVAGVFMREDPTKVTPTEAIVIGMREYFEATPESFQPLDPDQVRIGVSLEGAKSFCAEGSPGWGAIGEQELTEKLIAQLEARGIIPPFRPEP